VFIYSLHRNILTLWCQNYMLSVMCSRPEFKWWLHNKRPFGYTHHSVPYTSHCVTGIYGIRCQRVLVTYCRKLRPFGYTHHSVPYASHCVTGIYGIRCQRVLYEFAFLYQHNHLLQKAQFLFPLSNTPVLTIAAEITV